MVGGKDKRMRTMSMFLILSPGGREPFAAIEDH